MHNELRMMNTESRKMKMGGHICALRFQISLVTLCDIVCYGFDRGKRDQVSQNMLPELS